LFCVVELSELFGQKPMDVVGKEHDFKKTVGAFLVPEGVWGVGSAMSVSWVHVASIHNIVVGLSESRKPSRESIPVRHHSGSNFIWKGVVKLWKRDEEFLPKESVEDLHDHSEEFFHNQILLSSCELNILDSNLEFWQILIDNEISVFFWNDTISKFRNSELSDKPRENDREDRRNESSKGNEVDMREVSLIEDFSPVLNWLVREHSHEVFRDLKSTL
jgi:hypothetical protein